MEVTDNKKIDNNHSIEWGNSSWDEGTFFAIRNRFDNNGKFDVYSSGEIHWDDFNEMILESIRRKYFTELQLLDILSELTKQMKK